MSYKGMLQLLQALDLTYSIAPKTSCQVNQALAILGLRRDQLRFGNQAYSLTLTT